MTARKASVQPLVAAVRTAGVPSAPAVHGHTVGVLVSVADAGCTPFVRHPADGGAPVAARTTVDLTRAAPGDSVVLAFDQGDPTQPIVIGLVRTPATVAADVAPMAAPSPSADAALRHGRVISLGDDGALSVSVPGHASAVPCQVLQTGAAPPAYQPGDEVLVWQVPGGRAVVLGRVGLAVAPDSPVASDAALAARPQTLVLEAQGDIILRNAHARIKLGADGDIEIVGASLTSRTQRLLRLLAPLIKMN